MLSILVRQHILSPMKWTVGDSVSGRSVCIFLFTTAIMGHHPPIQWVPAAYVRANCGGGLK